MTIRRLGTVLIVALLVSGLAAHAADLYVPTQYPTIQAAVDGAAPGDTVHVAAGTFTGSVTVSKSDITLQGAGAAETIIEGDSGYGVWVRSAASGVTVQGFRVHPGAGTGVRVSEGAQATVIRCVASHSGRATGFFASGGSSLELTECTANDNAVYGALIRNAQGTLCDCSFIGNHAYGLRVDQGGTARVTKCTIVSSGKAGIYVGAGASVGSGATAEITHCVVSDSGREGMLVTSGGSAEIAGTSVTGSALEGVCLERGASATLSDCVACNCGSQGISVSSGASADLTRCITSDNHSSGILVFDDGSATATGCTANDSQHGTGFHAGGARHLELSGCTANNNRVYGACIRNCPGLVRDCSFSQTQSDGIRVGQGGTANVSGCSVTSSGRRGIAVLSGANAEITDTSVTGSALEGVCLQSGASATLSDCVACNCGTQGISVSSGASADLTRCITSDNHSSGILVFDDGSATATGCTANDSQHGTGFHAGGARHLELSGCTANNNRVYGACIRSCPAVVRDCTFVANHSRGVTLSGTNAVVADNNIHDNGASGIRVRPWPGGHAHGAGWQLNPEWAADDVVEPPTITGNTIAANGGYGIDCLDNAPANVATLADDNDFPEPNTEGRVRVAWYALVKVLQGATPIEGATVEATDAEGASVLSDSTNADGLAPAVADYHNAYTWPLMYQFYVDNDGALHDCTPHTVRAQAGDGSGRGSCTYSWDGTHKEEGFDIDGRYQIAIVELNAKPIADAGGDRTVEANTTGGANVILDASGSSDPDGDELTFTWLEGGEIIVGPTTDEQVEVFLALGEHEITLLVDDGYQDPATDTVTISVVDTTPPEFVFEILKHELWPPDHKMVLAAVVSGVTDICDPDPSVHITVTSDEPINGPGDGNTEADWEVVENGDTWEIWLRAERSGDSDGREYYIEVVVTDDSGNASKDSGTVVVPHDMAGG